MDHKILDTENANRQRLTALKARLKKLVLVIPLLIIINIIGQYFGLADLVIPSYLTKIIISNLISINLIGAFIGFIISLFPYHEINQKWRWIRGSIISILVIQILQSISILINFSFIISEHTSL